MNTKSNTLLLLAFPLLFALGCSSVPKLASDAPGIQPDVVLSRINDMSSRPSWLDETKSFKVEGGYIVSLGQTTIPAGDNLEAAFRIAENNAKGGVAEAIDDRLKFILQNAEEGTSTETNQVRYIGEEVSNLTTSSLRPDRQYWEKVATTTSDGQRVVQYRVYATVRMPESDFKAAVLDAIRKREGRGGISQDFADKVNHEWDSFVNGNQNQNNQQQPRTTASTN